MKGTALERARTQGQVASAQDFPKSGFDMSYSRRQDYVLGRLHVSGYQHMMPGDKFSGNNKGDFTFNRLVVPNLSEIMASQHNFYVPYRILDRTFEEAFAPNKNNDMSNSWHAPYFSVKTVVSTLVSGINSIFAWSTFFRWANGKQLTDVLDNTGYTNYQSLFATLIDPTSAVYVAAKKLYLTDVLADIYDYAGTFFIGVTPGTSTIRDALSAWIRGVLFAFIGPNSLLDQLGYNYVRLYDLDLLFSLIGTSQLSAGLFANTFDDVLQNEYALRAYYAVWYEYYRDPQLEPVSSDLPRWKDFGSTSVYSSNPLMLLMRCRSWNPDLYVSAQPDDMCRHVFAPVFEPDSQIDIKKSNTNEDFLDAEGVSINRNITNYELSWRDPLSGTQKSLFCPLPANVNDSLIGTRTLQSVTLPYTLDLYTLRTAQKLEQYLKRNFYFGDEYNDRMLAHYGVKVSDYRVNRPEMLGAGSVDSSKSDQMKSPSGTGYTEAGQRTLTMEIKTSGDGFQYFAEEFGIVLNFISFMPIPQYAGICPQNLLYKQTDFPLPEFATQNEEFGRVMEVATNGVKKSGTASLGMFGHFPYAHAYRARVNSVGGHYLDDKFNYSFARFFGLDTAQRSPKLNYEFIHCRPNVQMFADSILLDGQLYGSVDHEFEVQRVLPIPLENI